MSHVPQPNVKNERMNLVEFKASVNSQLDKLITLFGPDFSMREVDLLVVLASEALRSGGLVRSLTYGNSPLMRAFSEACGASSAQPQRLTDKEYYTRCFLHEFMGDGVNNADRKHASHQLGLLDPERFTRWHDGPPPSLGWWPTQLRGKKSNALRWWDGKQWSFPVWSSDPPYIVSLTSGTPAWAEYQPQVQWRHRPTSWPVESFT